MKKVFIIFSVILFTSIVSTSSKAWFFKETPSLFGIELDNNVQEYELLECTDTKDVRGLINNSGYLKDEALNQDLKNWKTYIYKDSKLPVLSGCVKPLKANNDFFNYKIHIYPKSKDIYAVTATHRVPLRNLKNCDNQVASLMQAIINTNKEKDFEYSSGYIPSKDSKDNDKHTIMRRGEEILKIRVLCTNYGVLDTFTKYFFSAFDNVFENLDSYYFIVVSIDNLDEMREAKEESYLKEKILQDNLDDKTGL